VPGQEPVRHLQALAEVLRAQVMFSLGESRLRILKT
jgi:hypothetical protein